MQYTNPKNNEILNSELTIVQAREIIKSNAPTTDGFAHDLAGKGMLSASQIFWLIKKAEQYNPNRLNPSNPPETVVGAGLAKLASMFSTAKQTIKRPKVKFNNNILGEIVISLAPDAGRNAGFLYIKADGIYMGKISPEGCFSPASQCPQQVKDYLRDFSENPEVVAGKYGRETGNCCFCSRDLTDERSVKVGYGPICASTFGLAWGD